MTLLAGRYVARFDVRFNRSFRETHLTKSPGREMSPDPAHRDQDSAIHSPPRA